MNVVALTAFSRKRRRGRSLGGGDDIALRRAQRNAADRRTDLPHLVIKTDAFQQAGSIRMDRNSGSDLPENLGLLEHDDIEAPGTECERSCQTSDAAADDCNAKRTRHVLDLFSAQ